MARPAFDSKLRQVACFLGFTAAKLVAVRQRIDNVLLPTPCQLYQRFNFNWTPHRSSGSERQRRMKSAGQITLAGAIVAGAPHGRSRYRIVSARR
jgi:hypothetical protein